MTTRTQREIEPSTGTYVTFQMAQEDYALSLEHVKEVLRAVAIRKTPHSLPFVKGVINLRGTVTPVIDLQQLFSGRAARYGVDSHIVIAQSRGSLVALIVDEVRDVLQLPPENLQTPQGTIPISDYLTSVGQLGEVVLLILDLPRILESMRIAGLQKLESEEPKE